MTDTFRVLSVLGVPGLDAMVPFAKVGTRRCVILLVSEAFDSSEAAMEGLRDWSMEVLMFALVGYGPLYVGVRS